MRSTIILACTLIFLCLTSCANEGKDKAKKEISITLQAHPKKASLRGISVIDTNVIWLSGSKSTVLRTIDGGENWDTLSIPSKTELDFRDVEAFSAEEALVVSSGYPSRIYKTSDGGINWQLVHENLDSNAFMNSVFFKNKKEGLIFGDKLGDRHLVLKTLDGGNSWQRLADSILPEPLIGEHGYAASGSCIAQNSFGNFIIALGGLKSRVYVEDNKSWNAYPTTLNGGGNSTGIYSIASDGKILIAVGGDYLKPDSIYNPTISIDGGRSWKEDISSVNGYRSVIDFGGKNQVWIAAGINGLDYRFNRDSTWNYIPTEEINTLQFDPLGYFAWAAGPKGKIWKISIKD